MQKLSRRPSSPLPWRAATTLGLLALLLAGCKVGPDFTPPEAPRETGYTPDGTPEPTPKESAEPPQHFALGQRISGHWWQLFHSPQINEVLDRAIAGNRTLAAAQATLAQAQEAVNQATGALYPQVALTGTAERQKLSLAAVGINQPPIVFNFFALGPTVTYALDVFGGNKRFIEEQEARAASADFQLDATYLTLTGDTVTEMLEIAAIRAEIKTTQDIIADDEENLRLVRAELSAGVATQLDVQTATSQLEADRTLLPPLRQQLSVARHTLSVLTGQAPVNWSPPDIDLAALALPQELLVSLPSELVRQRPDILAAEAQLHAASAAIGVATAQLYPNITLTASIAQEALVPNQFFAQPSNVWAFGAGLTAPLFEGGTLLAQKRAAEDAFRVVLANYEQTILQSFGQVANIMQALAHDAELLDAERRALTSAEASLALTRLSYTAGNVGVLQVLDAQRLYERARLGYVQAQSQRFLDTAQLFIAMGGGWWDWQPQGAAEQIPAKAAAR